MIPVRVRRRFRVPAAPAVRRGGCRGGILRHLLLPLAVAAAVAVLAWMLLVPALVSARLEQATGFSLRSGRLMANPLSGHLRLADASVANPTGWPDARFAQIALLDATVRPWAWRERPLSVPKVTLDIDTLHIVVGADGRDNLARWDEALAALSSLGAAPRIGLLRLSVDRVLVSDYSHGGVPRLLEFRPRHRRDYRSVVSWRPVWDDLLAELRR